MKKIKNAASQTKGGTSFGPCATVDPSGIVTHLGPGCSAIHGCWELLPGGQGVGHALSIMAPKRKMDMSWVPDRRQLQVVY